MSTEQLAQALRNMLDITKDSEGVAGYRSDGKISDWGDFYEVDEAWDALAAHEEEKAQAAGGVDCIGLALELEFQSKLVESLATERAMRAAAHGLRLLAGGVAPVAPVAVPLTADELADRCEAWLEYSAITSNIVDAFEAGFRDCELAHGIGKEGGQG